MAIKEILQLGNPKLYQISNIISQKESSEIPAIINDLHDTMMNFKKHYGCGRAIAAPQIGIFKRLIYMNINNVPKVYINPEIVFKSKETFELWDDCMSFPTLLVKVIRHKKIKVKYYDQSLNTQEEEFEGDLAELFQHEYDHLDGILATMRAIDNKSLTYKTEFNKR